MFHFPLWKVSSPGESNMISYFLSKVAKIYSLRQNFLLSQRQFVCISLTKRRADFNVLNMGS